MLLWSVLHLTGTQAVNADYERLGQPSVTLDDIRRFRQLDSKAPGHPGVPLGLGRRDDHRPARPGRRHERRHGDRAEVARRPLQPARLRDLRLPRLRRLRRRLHDGGRRVGGGVARRATSASTTSAGSTTTTTSRSRATRASPSPRTSRPASSATGGTCCASATPTTSTASSTRSRSSGRRRAARPSSSSTATSATARRTSRTPPRRTASRSATRRSGSRKRGYGWPEDAKFLVPDGVREHFAAGIGARGAQARQQLDGALRRVPRQVSRARDRDRPDAAARAAGRLGPQPARLPGRPEGHRRARRLGQGAERARAEHPLVPRRLGGPRAVEQDDADVRGRGRLPGRHARAARTCTSASASTRWRRS